MSKLIVFYTFNPIFDYYDETLIRNDLNIVMLKMSIYTMQRELGDKIEIRVYTTETELMTKILSKYSCKIMLLKDEYVTGSELKISDIVHRFKKAGHGRIFLLYDIIWNENRPCLYLDNDTGICLGWGNKLYNGLLTLKTPAAWCTEQYNTIENWCYVSGAGYPNGWPRLITGSGIRNNGIIFIPNNYNGRKCTRLIKEAYAELNDYYNKWNYGFDMTALTIVWDDYKFPLLLGDVHPVAFGLTHYYGQKYAPYHQQLYQRNIQKWKNILEAYEN